MIEKNKVVSMSYCLKDTQGKELDRAEADKPLDYLHGSGNIVPGLENALEGLNVGDKKDVTVKPEDGYGEFVADLNGNRPYCFSCRPKNRTRNAIYGRT